MSWQIQASDDLDKEQPPHLRMSQAGHCPVALAYAGMEIRETDPPGEDAEHRMAMGHMAEILIVRGLHARGWETRHTVLSDGGQLEVEIEIVFGEKTWTITGHPDGICRHPEFTKGHWVLLECKSMSVDRAVEVEQYGIEARYPSYLIQAALYGKRLYEMGEIVHPRRAVFGMMDREGRLLPPERLAWQQDVVDGTLDKLSGVVGSISMGVIFPPAYEQESSECRYCGYHSLCWGAPRPENTETPRVVRVTDRPTLEATAQTWRELKPQVDIARDALQRESNNQGHKTIEVDGVLAGYFYPRETPVYDAAALEYRVPMDILRECLSVRQPNKRAPFWVRTARK